MADMGDARWCRRPRQLPRGVKEPSCRTATRAWLCHVRALRCCGAAGLLLALGVGAPRGAACLEVALAEPGAVRLSFDDAEGAKSASATRESGPCPLSAVVALVASASGASDSTHELASAFCGGAAELAAAGCFCDLLLQAEVRAQVDVNVLSLWALADALCAGAAEPCEPLPERDSWACADSPNFAFTSAEGTHVTCEVAQGAPAVWCARAPTQAACRVACDACAEPGTGTVVGGESVDAGVAAAAPAPGDEDGVVCEDRFAECEVRAGEGACDEALVGALDAGRMARACPLSCNSCGSAGPPLAGGEAACGEDAVEACTKSPIVGELCGALEIVRLACPRRCYQHDPDVFSCPNTGTTPGAGGGGGAAAPTEQGQGGQQPAVPPRQCPEDLFAECDALSATGGCSSALELNACPRACDTCEPAEPCTDILEDCAALADSGLCSSAETRTSCPYSCGINCEALQDEYLEAVPEDAGCRDLDERACASAAAEGGCDVNAVAREACPLTCQAGCGALAPFPGPAQLCEDPTEILACDGACAPFDLLGDGVCDMPDKPRGANFACPELMWDLGDCPTEPASAPDLTTVP